MKFKIMIVNICCHDAFNVNWHVDCDKIEFVHDVNEFFDVDNENFQIFFWQIEFDCFLTFSKQNVQFCIDDIVNVNHFFCQYIQWFRIDFIEFDDENNVVFEIMFDSLFEFKRRVAIVLFFYCRINVVKRNEFTFVVEFSKKGNFVIIVENKCDFENVRHIIVIKLTHWRLWQFNRYRELRLLNFV